MLKVQNAATFSQKVEELVLSQEVTYLEAIVMNAEGNKIDLETVPKLLTETLKAKLENEATKLNLINRGKTNFFS